MTLHDLLDRVDVKKDGDKMLLWSDGIGWSNLEINITNRVIELLPSRDNSPFSSDK